MGRPLHLDVAFNDGSSHRVELLRTRLTLAVQGLDRKSPVFIHAEVTSLYPATGFLGMPPARPAPEHAPD